MKTRLFFPALCALMMCLVACGPTNEPNEPSEPNSPITGVFSVSATTQVTFAPGNLQYQASTNTWRFAENQYDIIGKDNENISISYNGWIDLFGWGTGNNPTIVSNVSDSTYETKYPTFVDWGTNIGSYASNTWRTLRHDEWNYIFKERPNASQLYGTATVCGQTGLVVIPDNTLAPLTFKAGMHGYTQNIYSSADWEKFESVGALFLPASGYRNGTNVSSVGDYGNYWCSTPDGDLAYYLSFGGNEVLPQNFGRRYYGHAVRLAQNVTNEPNEPNNPNDSIIGIFSVSTTKKVNLAPGNLQYQASTNTWRFAENQYDVIGEDNKNISDTYDGWIDLFCWGTGNCPTLAATIDNNNKYTITYVDWGTNKIGEYAANTWRTLRHDEWNYIFKERPNAEELYSTATVNGMAGIIILPDSATLSLPFNPGTSGYSQNVYSATEWAQIEKEGAIFLPAAGYTYNSSNSSVFLTVAEVGEGCFYWGSTQYSTSAVYYVFYHSSLVNPQAWGTGGKAKAVRLARDL